MNEDEPWWHESRTGGSTGAEGATGADDSGRDAEGDQAASAFGSGPEEAARLFTAIRDRVLTDPAAMKAGMQMMEMFTSLRGAMDNPVAPGDAPECAYCPICQAISRAQNISPESVESVTAAAIQFADTLRQAIGDDEDDGRGDTVRHVPMDDDPDEDDQDEDSERP